MQFASINKGIEATHQGQLQVAVHKLFKGENIQKNVRREAELINPTTGKYLELDIWLPNLNVCFEFQDAYHYTTTWDSPIPLHLIRHQDQIKKNLVLSKRDTLIQVPCWWDGSDERLISTIQFDRPDLLSAIKSSVAPIPLNPINSYFEETYIPGVGELMLASFPSRYFNKILSSENFWWIGEKYDGIRVCWNSTNRKLYTRGGINLQVPSNILRKFPENFLDGELWFGRGYFPESQKVVLSIEAVNWSLFRSVSFDDPNPSFHHQPFEDRYERVLFSFIKNHPFAILAPRIRCMDFNFLKKSVQNIIKDGGEGIMLRKPQSVYIPGRSTALLKLKAARADQEALIIEVFQKEPKYLLQLPDGIQFELTSDYMQNGILPKRGEIVSFSYDSYSKLSIPVNPKVYRIRSDVSWDHVLRHFTRDESVLNFASSRSMGNKSHVPGYWSTKRKNLKQFFLNFAKTINMDPLVPDNWYTVSKKAISSVKGGHAVLHHFQDQSFVHAIIKLFPELNLDKRKFIGKAHWDFENNRRRFFEKLARSFNLDPLDPNDWYKLSRKQIHGVLGAAYILNTYHKSSPVKALTYLFPNIGLDKQRLQSSMNRVDSHSCPCCHKPRKDHKCSGIFCNNKDICNKPSLHQKFLFKRRLHWCHNNGLDVSLLLSPSFEKVNSFEKDNISFVEKDISSFPSIQLYPVTPEAKRKFKVNRRKKL